MERVVFYCLAADVVPVLWHGSGRDALTAHGCDGTVGGAEED